MGYCVCWVLGTLFGMILMCILIVGDDSRK